MFRLVRIAALAITLLVARGGVACAQSTATASIAGIGIGPDDARVLDRLDAMLGVPVHRLPAPRGRSRDDYLIAASSASERYVVLVDLRGRRVYAFEPAAQRAVERAIPEELARGEWYSVAGIAYELLELLGVDVGEPPTASADPPVVPPSEEPSEEVTPSAPAASEGPRPLFAGVGFGVGAQAVLGLVDEPRFLQLLGSIEVALAPTRRHELHLAILFSGLGREQVRSSQGSATAELTYRRPELGLRIGFGRRLTRRLALYGTLVGGVGFRRFDLHVSGSGMSDRDSRDRDVGGFLGFGLDARIPLARGFSVGITGSLDTLLRAADYTGSAGSEFHESPVRLSLGLSLLWGTSSLGSDRPQHQSGGSE